MACVTFAPDKRFRMDDTHRNFPHSDTKTTFWSTLAARRVATVLGKTRQPSVESQWGNYASSPPVGAVDCPSNSGASCRCGEAWLWKFEEHTTFEGELRSTRRKVGENPRSTVRLPRWSASGAGRVREVGVFPQFQFLGPV